MAMPPARSCWNWRATSPPRCRTGSAWRWNRSRGSSAHAGKNDIAAPVPMTVHTRAALLMLGSTAFFAFMVIAIRLASETLHTFEIAFFRNFFGLVAALPLLLHHGPGLLRTQQ